MSLQLLHELGDSIIKAAESSPLQSEIAAVSLESIHALLISTDQNATNEPQQPIQQNQNIFADQMQGPYQQPAHVPGYGFDEHVTPAVIGPQYNADIINQANSIPFLYHQMPE